MADKDYSSLGPRNRNGKSKTVIVIQNKVLCLSNVEMDFNCIHHRL